MGAILSNVWGATALILLFGMTIFIHELGHYLTARWLGLVVQTFSIGFGPAIWKTKRNGITYKIGCIPFGGYVALPQLDPSGMSRVQGAEDKDGEVSATQEDEVTYPAVAPWRKIIVSVSGAIGNVLLAILIAWVVYWVGMPAGPSERSAVVGYVDVDSAAYHAGLRIGDEVTSVNGVEVRTWQDVRVETALHEHVTLEAKRPDGTTLILDLPTGEGVMGEQTLLGVTGCDICEVLTVEEGSTAAAAGVKPGDRIVRFDGIDICSRGHLIDRVTEAGGRTTTLTVQRALADGVQEVVLQVTPVLDPALGRARIGIGFNMKAVDLDTVVRPKPLDQLKGHASMIIRVLQALTTPRQAKAASKAVGGPVAIIFSYWAIVRSSIMLAIWFTGLLNINLAILNLLPIPVLDGGHVVFSLWEWAAGKPAPPKVINALVNVFAMLLIGVMLMLSVRDVDRMTSLGHRVRSLFNRGERVDASAETNATERITVTP